MIADAENDHSFGYHVLDAHDNIWVISDYSGKANQYRHRTYAFLILTEEAGNFFLDEIIGDREQLLDGARTISYKGLNDAIKRMYLAAICEVGLRLHGHLFVFCVDKRIPAGAFYDGADNKTIKDATATWNTSTRDEFVLVSILLRTLLHGLGRDGQNIYWMTDNDDFTHTEQMRAQCGRVFTHTSMKGWTTKFGSFNFGPKENFAADPAYLDLLALPDLAAGAFADISQDFPVEPNVFRHHTAVSQGGVFREKSIAIYKWFMSNVNAPLRRVAISIDAMDDGAFQVINLLGAARNPIRAGDFAWPSGALLSRVGQKPIGPWFPLPNASGVVRKYLAEHREYLEKVMPEGSR